MSAVESWRVRDLVNVDCVTCGERMTDGFEATEEWRDSRARAKARAWARRHAARNPGHLAAVEVVVGRVYKVHVDE